MGCSPDSTPRTPAHWDTRSLFPWATFKHACLRSLSQLLPASWSVPHTTFPHFCCGLFPVRDRIFPIATSFLAIVPSFGHLLRFSRKEHVASFSVSNTSWNFTDYFQACSVLWVKVFLVLLDATSSCKKTKKTRDTTRKNDSNKKLKLTPSKKATHKENSISCLAHVCRCLLGWNTCLTERDLKKSEADKNQRCGRITIGTREESIGDGLVAKAQVFNYIYCHRRDRCNASEVETS